MSVKRMSHWTNSEGCYFKDDKNGDYVFSDEYDRLAAELVALREIIINKAVDIKALIEEIGNWSRKYDLLATEAQKQIEELKQHIYKLVGDVPSIGKYGVIKEK